MSRRVRTAHASRPRGVVVLGSTGSIGRHALEILTHLGACGDGEMFRVIGLAAHRSAEEVFAQASAFGVGTVALTDASCSEEPGRVRRVLTGSDAPAELVRAVAQPGDLVVNAIVGIAGLSPTLAAIECGCDVALANKESLVAAGDLVMRRAAAQQVSIIPVDSEHAAIALCLAGVRPQDVRRVVLTASGGPFLDWPLARMADAKPEEALQHPNWQMGPKITIDCASLMNKAFELIEAHWLFNLPADRIDAVVHPQSIVHGFVELCDGAVIAQLAPPDMRIPIRQAITGNCGEGSTRHALDLSALGTLEFRPVDAERFPAMMLAQNVMAAGGTAGAILNGANEAAVEAFREGAIRFGGISRLVSEALEHVPIRSADAPEDIFDADEAARSFVKKQLVRCITTTRS